MNDKGNLAEHMKKEDRKHMTLERGLKQKY